MGRASGSDRTLARQGAGFWSARVPKRSSLPLIRPESSHGTSMQSLWDRVANASRRMAERFAACGGGVGQIYDEKSKAFDTVVKEYLLAWAALLDEGDPSLALANTVEVQSLSGRTIGLIVLPSHPLACGLACCL